MSITGVVALGVLLDVLLPKGQTSKYIKGIFSLIVIYVIIRPLPSLLRRAEDLDELLFSDYTASMEVDETFLQSIEYMEASAEERVEAKLKANGFSGATVKIVYADGRRGKIDYINVDFSDTVINGSLSGIEISEIKELVSDELNVKKEEVRIIGSNR